MDQIVIRGARTHNLQNLDLILPRNQLIVITGPSGSGKSSLAFDTLYAEGQRRYVESLSAYARQFLSVMDKPDVDHIAGLSPAIAIQQKTTSHNPRSTVGTTTEVYDYLRLLFARVGIPHCPTHQVALAAQTVSQMVDSILQRPLNSRWMLLAPVVQGRKGSHAALLAALQQQGFLRARINGKVHELDMPIQLAPRSQHHIEVVVDRFSIRPDLAERLAGSVETALQLGQGWIRLAPLPGSDPEAEMEPDLALQEVLFSARYACPHCGFAVEALEPKAFSFNNPAGACPDCNGLGEEPHYEWHRLVEHPELPWAEGAIPLWTRVAGFGDMRALRAFAKHFKIDPRIPFDELSGSQQQLVLQGDSRYHGFPGFAAFFVNRYRETQSDWAREELLKQVSLRPCQGCGGTRLHAAARAVQVGGYGLGDWVRWPLSRLHHQICHLELSAQQQAIAEKIIREIDTRVSFLVEVGLHYLSLDRRTETLSGGEAQRIRLASQIGSALVGVLYILDEPTIGLHQRDNARLLESLVALKNLGNTVVVVEHDEDTMRLADHLVDIGPGAGIHGGRVVAQGAPADVMAHPESVTGHYLAGRKRIPIPVRQPVDSGRCLVIEGAHGNNLQHITVSFPLGVLVCVTGVSGSGKSTLINDTLYPVLMRHVWGSGGREPAQYTAVRGLSYVDQVIAVDQAPIGRTPRSNPATYTGILTPIRELFAAVPEAKIRGYTPGRFSFNVKGGRCEACEGDGLIRIAMHFLSDVYVQCEACQGKRYNRETLEIRYKGRHIADVLSMSVEEALVFFEAVPVIRRKLETLQAVGLGYIQLGQSATTLSGGEAQRIKLAKELSKRQSGHTVYVLDEPTTGLHFQDVALLMQVLLALRDRGHTLIVIEHHLDVIKCADWIIDLGPDGGEGGGQVVAEGPPEKVCTVPGSATGFFLKPYLDQQEANQPT